MNSSGYRDVDVALTTRELARLIKNAGIDFTNLEDEDFDSIMVHQPGQPLYLRCNGGVMEAALRTVYEVVTGKHWKNRV